MFNKQQYREFRRALKNGVNPRILENMTAEQMRETRLAAESKLDLTYFKPDVSAEKMNAVRNLLLIKADIDPAFVHSFNAEQLHQIKLGLDLGLDVEKYRYPYLTSGQMRRMRIGLLATKLLKYVQANGLFSIFTIRSFKSYNDPKLILYTEKVIEHIENKNPEREQTADMKSYVNEQFIPAMDEVHMADIQLTEEHDEPEVSDKASDHTLLAQNTAFINCALISVSEHDFRIIKDYDMKKSINDYPEADVVTYDNAIAAAKDYQSIVIELEKEDVQFQLATQNLSAKERVVMDLHDEINEKADTGEPELQAFMVSMLKEHGKDIRSPLLNKIAESSCSPEVKEAANLILEQNGQDKEVNQTLEMPETEKAHEDDKSTRQEQKEVPIEKLIDKAKDVSTSSTKLTRLAESNDDPNLLVAVMQNPNCSTTLINKYLEHENPDVQKTAEMMMKQRSQMKSINVSISEKQILKELPSHLLDKEGKPVMLSVVRLPNSSFGVNATCVVPSSSIKKNGDDIVVKLNPERTIEIRVENESKGHITGKELSEQLGENSKRPLQERLNSAQQRQALNRNNEPVHEKKAGLEQEQPVAER